MTHDDLLSEAFKNLGSLGLKAEDIVKDGELTLKKRIGDASKGGNDSKMKNK